MHKQNIPHWGPAGLGQGPGPMGPTLLMRLLIVYVFPYILMLGEAILMAYLGGYCLHVEFSDSRFGLATH